MERKRLYIVPTVFGAYIGMILFAILLGSLNNGSNAALLFTSVACSMLALALIQTHQRLAGVRFLSIHAFPCHEGDPITIRVTLDHPSSKLRQGLTLAMGSSQLPFDLPPNSPKSLDLTLPPLQRGAHPMGRLQLNTRRPLNIARAWSWVWPNQTLLIYPRLEANCPAPPGKGMEENRLRSARVGTEVHHLRDFRLGDAMRDIAWKASARNGRLMAREYEAHGGGLQSLNWNDVAHLPTEQALSRLATWVVQADNQGLTIELKLPTHTIGPSQGTAHRHACLTALARMPADVHQA